MKVYWVRHGKTKFNLERRLQGWSDSPLLENDDAYIKASEKLKGIKFDHVCSSDLKRAIDTKNLILKELGNNYETKEYKEFREISFGKLETMLIEDILKYHSDMWKLFKQKSDLYQPQIEFNAESINDVKARVQQGLEKLKKEFGENSTIMIVSHGTTISIMNGLNEIPDNGDVIVNEY